MNKILTGWLRGTVLFVLAIGASAAWAGNKSIPIQVTVTNVNRCMFAVTDYALTVTDRLVPGGDERLSNALPIGVHCTRPLPVQLQIALLGHDDGTLSDPALSARIELKEAAGAWEPMTKERKWACTEADHCDLQLRAWVRAAEKASTGEKQLNGTLQLSVIID